MTKKSDELLTLPEWLEALLPEASEAAVVTANADGSKFTIALAGEKEEFDDFSAVADALDAHYGDYLFDPSVHEALKETNPFDIEIGIGLPLENGMVRLLIGMDDKIRKMTLREGYRAFLKTAQNYALERNFINAWHFIDRHPAFWTANDLENSPFTWNQSGHMSQVSVYVEQNEQGEPVVILETGAHVPDGENSKPYSTYYADWRLEVEGATYEEAVIALADRVNICYDVDGNPRPDADERLLSSKPEWVATLEERLATAKD